MITVFALAGLAGAAIGFPVDYLRRRAPQPAASVAGFANAVVLIAGIALIAATGLVSGAAGVGALVLGVVAGSAAADATATVAWGSAARRYYRQY